MEQPLSEYYLWNDTFVPTDEVESLRPLFDNAIYEVIRVEDGVPLFFDAHFVRFQESSTRMDKPLPYEAKAIAHRIRMLLQRNGIEEGNVKILWTEDFLGDPQLVIYMSERRAVSQSEKEDGVKTATYQFERKQPGVKVQRNDYREETAKIIKEKGVFELLLYDENCLLREGSRSNVFFVQEEKIYTAPLGEVLEGITRIQVMKSLKKNNVQVEEEAYPLHALESVDACFLTGTSIGILPIRQIDACPFDSAHHPAVKALQKAYEECVQQEKDHFAWD